MSCKVIYMPPRHRGLGPSMVMFDHRRKSINYIDYPVGTRLSTAEKKRATAQLMRGCKELARHRKRR